MLNPTHKISDRLAGQRYDRNSEHPELGEWRTTILPLIEGKPHIAKYLHPASVNTQALINAFYGLRRPGD